MPLVRQQHVATPQAQTAPQYGHIDQFGELVSNPGFTTGRLTVPTRNSGVKWHVERNAHFIRVCATAARYVSGRMITKYEWENRVDQRATFLRIVSQIQHEIARGPLIGG